jgi:hypothetical protein
MGSFKDHRQNKPQLLLIRNSLLIAAHKAQRLARRDLSQIQVKSFTLNLLRRQVQKKL